MSIQFYQDVNNEMKIIDSADLNEEIIANFVADRGLVSEIKDGKFIYFIPWKLFLEMVRDNMSEGQQEMNPDFMKIVDNNDYHINLFIPIDDVKQLITAADGIINIFPDALKIQDEENIIIEFVSEKKIEKFDIVDDSDMLNNVLFIGGILLIIFILYKLNIFGKK